LDGSDKLWVVLSPDECSNGVVAKFLESVF
jgi:hypothetical protein